MDDSEPLFKFYEVDPPGKDAVAIVRICCATCRSAAATVWQDGSRTLLESVLMQSPGIADAESDEARAYRRAQGGGGSGRSGLIRSRTIRAYPQHGKPFRLDRGKTPSLFVPDVECREHGPLAAQRTTVDAAVARRGPWGLMKVYARVLKVR